MVRTWLIGAAGLAVALGCGPAAAQLGIGAADRERAKDPPGERDDVGGPPSTPPLSERPERRIERANGVEFLRLPIAQPGPVVDLPDDNLFIDPSFEIYDRYDEGRVWWNFAERDSAVWHDFEIRDDRALSGERSAYAPLDSDTQGGQRAIQGVVQEVEAPDGMPRYLSGWYRVEDWQRGCKAQYLQIVVIVWDFQEQIRGQRWPNIQVAATMAGVDGPPIRIGNRKFAIAGPVEPVQDEWVFFEFDLHELFDFNWGIIPSKYGYLRVFYEVRYDDHTGFGPAAKADVWFDDLYIGDTSRLPTIAPGD